MKYYKTPKFAKILTSTGFITITACFLIAIGAIGWFTLSRNNKIETPSENQSQQEYPNTNSSYDNIVDTPNATPSTDVNESVNDIPYIENTPSAQPTQPIIEKQTFVLPIKGNISKGYSDSALQYSATYGDMRLHTGVDILCENGSNIKSVGSGIVKSIIDDVNLGKVIVIDYDNSITVKYCGMASVNVKENDKIATGEIIGTSGEVPSECADKPHIHIEVIVDNEYFSPLKTLGLE